MSELLQKLDRMEEEIALMAVENAELKEKLAAKDAELERVQAALAQYQELIPELINDTSFVLGRSGEFLPVIDKSTGNRSKYKDPIALVAKHWIATQAALASPAAELSRANEIELNGVRKFQEYMREQTKLFGGDVGTAMLDAILTNYIQAQPAPVARQLDIEDQLKEIGHD